MTSARGPAARRVADPGPDRGAVTHEARRLAGWIGTLKLPEVVLFALMFTDVGPILAGHASELFLGCAVLLALFRTPAHDLGRYQMLVPLAGAALFYVAAVSFLDPPEDGSADWRLRLLRLVAVTILVFVLASGRIDLRSAVAGVALVCVVNVPLFYAGVVQDSYGGYLTGLIGDKNFAGLTYAVVGLLCVALVRRLPLKVLVLCAFAGPLWLTGSRTSLAGYALGAVWLVLGPRLPLLGKLVLGALSYVAVRLTAEDFSQIGVFSDRAGSDLLRARIDAASEIKVHEAGFFGDGLGSAFVVIEPDRWFFHNSYWTALVEGGWPWLGAILILTVVALLHPLRPRTGAPLGIAMGLGVVLLVTGERMGEVFYTLPWALAVAYGLQTLLRARDGDPTPGSLSVVAPDTPDQVLGAHARGGTR